MKQAWRTATTAAIPPARGGSKNSQSKYCILCCTTGCEFGGENATRSWYMPDLNEVHVVLSAHSFKQP